MIGSEKRPDALSISPIINSGQGSLPKLIEWVPALTIGDMENNHASRRNKKSIGCRLMMTEKILRREDEETKRTMIIPPKAKPGYETPSSAPYRKDNTGISRENPPAVEIGERRLKVNSPYPLKVASAATKGMYPYRKAAAMFRLAYAMRYLADLHGLARRDFLRSRIYAVKSSVTIT